MAVMFVSQAQLECGLRKVHSSCAGTKPRTRDRLYLPRFGTIMAMDCGESRPHGEVNVVCALDIHRYAHSRRVRHERMRRMAGGHDDTGADGLLSEIIVKDLPWDEFHDVASKETNHSQVHTCIHQTKRVAGSDDTIKHWQIFKSPTDDINLWMSVELRAKNVAKFASSIYKNQLHGQCGERHPTLVFTQTQLWLCA